MERQRDSTTVLHKINHPVVGEVYPSSAALTMSEQASSNARMWGRTAMPALHQWIGGPPVAIGGIQPRNQLRF